MNVLKKERASFGRKMKEFEFIRWGGLSPVKQKERFVPDKILKNPGDREFGFFGTFHRPPCRRGIYAFIPGFIEMFLVAWKIYSTDEEGNYHLKKEYEHSRRFKHQGKVWTHIYIIDPEIKYYRKRDSWYETDTESLHRIIKLEKWKLSKEITSKKQDEWNRISCKSFQDFKNAWRIYSKDHFEVFIERLH